MSSWNGIHDGIFKGLESFKLNCNDSEFYRWKFEIEHNGKSKIVVAISPAGKPTQFNLFGKYLIALAGKQKQTSISPGDFVGHRYRLSVEDKRVQSFTKIDEHESGSESEAA